MMDDWLFLTSEFDLAKVVAFATRLGWVRGDAYDRAPDATVTPFQGPGDATMEHVQSDFLLVEWLCFGGPDSAARCQSFRHAVDSDPGHHEHGYYTKSSLIQDWLDDPEDDFEAQEAIRYGIALCGGTERHPWLRAHLQVCSGNGNTKTRHAMLNAVAYLRWPSLIPFVEAMAEEHDDPEGVTEDAVTLLELLRSEPRLGTPTFHLTSTAPDRWKRWLRSS